MYLMKKLHPVVKLNLWPNNVIFHISEKKLFTFSWFGTDSSFKIIFSRFKNEKSNQKKTEEQILTVDNAMETGCNHQEIIIGGGNTEILNELLMRMFVFRGVFHLF